MKKIKKLTILSTLTAVSLILSYLELLLPPIYPSVPGIKMGIANIISVFILYVFGFKEAAASSVIRISITSILFGNPTVFIYSLAGAVFSLITMEILKKTRLFSYVGISVAGAVMHNAGQTLVAAVLMHTKAVIYYMAPLTASGTLSGILVGLCSALLIKKFRSKIK